MYSSLSGKVAVFKQMQMIANNLANMNTTGFKAERVIFEKALNKESGALLTSFEKDIDQPSRMNAEELVKIKGSYTDLTQGSLESTGNTLDLAIEGEGFFVVQTPEGERFTRAGNFRVDDQKRLVTQSGNPVMGVSGEITISGSDVKVMGDGNITANGQNAGRIRVVQLERESLVREQGMLFRNEGGASTEVQQIRVASGYLESSNVNAVQELVQMINAHRTYDALQKTDAASTKMNELRNQELGTL